MPPARKAEICRTPRVLALSAGPVALVIFSAVRSMCSVRAMGENALAVSLASTTPNCSHLVRALTPRVSRSFRKIS